MSRVALVLCALALPLAAAAAFAGNVELEGRLLGTPLPFHYNLTGSDLYFHQGKPYIEVRGEGDCHTEWHQECHPQGNPPVMVCHQVPQYVCYQARAQYVLPESVTLRAREVFYNDVKIGDVKSFLFWTWIKLAPNARLKATHNRAVLAINTGNAPTTDRAEVFARLYTEPFVDLMVKFQTATNTEARQILRAAGYDGELATTNDWSERDITTDEIGVRLPVRQAAALIAKLKASPRVVTVRPATAAGE